MSPLSTGERALYGTQLGRFMQNVTGTPDFPRAAQLASEFDTMADHNGTYGTQSDAYAATHDVRHRDTKGRKLSLAAGEGSVNDADELLAAMGYKVLRLHRVLRGDERSQSRLGFGLIEQRT